MRRWMVLPLLVLLACCDAVQAAKIGVYFDERGETTRLQVDAGKPFRFYVSVSGIPGGIFAFECQVEVDPRITVTGRSLREPRAIDMGSGDDNWVVGLGDVLAVGGVLPLLDYDAVLLAPEEGLWIGLGPAQTNDSPRVPQYMLSSEDGQILEFDEVAGAVLNTEVGTWGDLKENYEGN